MRKDYLGTHVYRICRTKECAYYLLCNGINDKLKREHVMWKWWTCSKFWIQNVIVTACNEIIGTLVPGGQLTKVNDHWGSWFFVEFYGIPLLCFSKTRIRILMAVFNHHFHQFLVIRSLTISVSSLPFALLHRKTT